MLTVDLERKESLMADNTFNFDLDAPAVPTLTLDPTPAAEEKAAPAQQEAPAPETQVNLTPEEQAMVDQFAEKIDITNSQQVLQYGSACQKKIGDFSEAALSKVATKDLGEVGDMYTALLGGEGIITLSNGSKIKLKIKPETQNGTKVRVRGKGYDRGDGTFGDLMITYNVKLPTSLNEKQKELLRQMKEAK